MEVFSLTKSQTISNVTHCLYELENGLVVVAGSDQNWVSFILLGLLGSYQEWDCAVLNKDEPGDNYYFKQIADNKVSRDINRKLFYYGAIRDVEKLEDALETAKNNLAVVAMHVISSEGVVHRMQDMLESVDKDIKLYENLLKCVISYDEDDD